MITKEWKGTFHKPITQEELVEDFPRAKGLADFAKIIGNKEKIIAFQEIVFE